MKPGNLPEGGSKKHTSRVELDVVHSEVDDCFLQVVDQLVSLPELDHYVVDVSFQVLPLLCMHL